MITESERDRPYREYRDRIQTNTNAGTWLSFSRNIQRSCPTCGVGLCAICGECHFGDNVGTCPEAKPCSGKLIFRSDG